jgi:hypothetical protein
VPPARGARRERDFRHSGRPPGTLPPPWHGPCLGWQRTARGGAARAARPRRLRQTADCQGPAQRSRQGDRLTRFRRRDRSPRNRGKR